jgi:hypothetical protein
MKKTIYIAKGEIARYESLTCQDVIVSGCLTVTGGITAKRISGSGIIRANVIKADSVVADDVTAGDIITNRLAVKRLSAVSAHAAESMAVSCYLEAGYVKTPMAILADADVEDMQADEIVRLSPKRHSLYGALLLSSLKTFFTWLRVTVKDLFDDTLRKNGYERAEVSADKPDAGPELSEEDAALVNDPEFRRFAALYKTVKTDRAATPADLSALLGKRPLNTPPNPAA